MQGLLTRRPVRSVSYVPVGEIVPGPMQPRRHFSEEGLRELRDSIIEHGVIQPLTVRIKGEKYELIAGERRLRAAKLAGLYEVPCIIMDLDLEQSGMISLIENIQRRDLDFVEEAEGIAQLIRLFGLSQEEAAKKLGKSQGAIANKLRILRLGPDILDRAREAGLTERHARALLRLSGEDRQREALDFIIDQRMTVSQAENYIDGLVRTPAEENFDAGQADVCPDGPGPLRDETPPGGIASPDRPSRRRSLFVMKDVRLFMNSLSRSLDLMRRGGIEADISRVDTDSEVVLTVTIAKK